MEPSSFTISQSTPTSSRSARAHRSTPASVWPARLSTPPERARNGKTWPGRANSPRTRPESARAFTVIERSWAEIPVAVPSIRSTETVNAVRIDSVLWTTISGRSRSSARSSDIGAQITPLVWRIMNVIFSDVMASAATMRSPSFSRSSSSTTTRNSPRANALMASSIWANGISRALPGHRFSRRAAVQLRRDPPRSGRGRRPPRSAGHRRPDSRAS